MILTWKNLPALLNLAQKFIEIQGIEIEIQVIEMQCF